jgi:hypothetical protein
MVTENGERIYKWKLERSYIKQIRFQSALFEGRTLYPTID